MISTSGVPTDKILGIGVGMPGFVNGSKGVNYSFLETNGLSLSDFLRLHLDLPVFIENDSSLIALAELRFGGAKRHENAMVINIGWGVGLGLIINNRLFRGSNGFAGEFSHIPLFSNDKLCNCGKRGCLETESSLFVLVERAIEGLKAGRISSLEISSLSLDKPEASSTLIIDAARKGDQFAVELISGVGYNIGRGVSVLIHLLNPEIIILGGRGTLAGRLWEAPIQQAINEHCIPRLGANTSIAISELGPQAQIIGAAVLVMENYNSDNFSDLYNNFFNRKTETETSKID